VSADLVSTAEEAVELALARPERARELALAVISGTHAARDDRAASTAHRALGEVATGLEDLPAAAEHLRSALRYARQARDDRREAEARMSLGQVLVLQGRGAAALREVDRAAAVLTGRDAGRLLNRRAAILYHLGRLDEALADYGAALAASRRCGDGSNEARAVNNRGVVHMVRGNYGASQRDLQRAEQLAVEFGQDLMLAGIRQNLGWLAARQGNVPLALARYDQAEEDFRPYCEPLGTLILDRCDLLLTARLLPEAMEAAQRAVATFSAGGLSTSVAEARLYLAEVALLQGDAEAARQAATEAAHAFARQRRPAWTARARYAVLRACLLDPGYDPRVARRTALRVARALEAAGWVTQTSDARVAAAGLALASGRRDLAERELREVAAARHRGTVEMRTRAWHAEALLRRAAGDRRGTRSALRAGLRLVEEYRAALGATDLRAAAAGYHVDLARVGFTMAVEDGRPAEAFRWVERARASVLRLRPVRPPDDEALAGDLAALRSVVSDLEEAISEGADTGALRARQRELERRVRDRCRRTPLGGLECPPPPPSSSALASRLDGRAVVELVSVHEQLSAVTFVDGRAAVTPLGSVAEVAAEVDKLLFLLRRLAGRHGSRAGQGAALAAARAVAGGLDAVLLRPLERQVGSRELVIVPTGVLHPVPWSLLPSCRGRPISVTPSATAWYEATARSGPARPGARAALVAGPGLPGAVQETTELARIYGSATVLSGRAATARRVLAALDGAGLAHLAVHGSLRSDNPLFSSLQFADGPLTVYDLEGLPRAPVRVVLSACESARATVHPGDDQLGVAAALLALGSAVLVASVVHVPDADTAPFMVRFHRRLAQGASPAHALAEVQEAALAAVWQGNGESTVSALATAGFVCLGAG
jgi:tetratricopeptide (TPR) repeat protein